MKLRHSWYWLTAGVILAALYVCLVPRRSPIEAKADQIEIGMSRADVIALLGNDYVEDKSKPPFVVLSWLGKSGLLTDQIFLSVAFDEKGQVVEVVQYAAEPSDLHKLKAKLGW
jgi:outer membrane protein assembly factor BamE (lipoprotein component of BamABCDE complex)